MERPAHVFEFLESSPEAEEIPPVVAVYGDESFLRRLAIQHLQESLIGDEEDAPISSFQSDEVAWRDVADELATRSLFGPSRRVVLIRAADHFVSEYRPQLEDYVASPSEASRLILEVKSWPGNTRLAKAVAKSGWAINCKRPERLSGKKTVADRPRLLKWITAWAKSQHGLKLKSTATEQLLELSGEDLGLIDQGLTKISLIADNPGDISAEDVVQIVGGWRTQTTWDMLDAACHGNAAEALQQLDRMLLAGEHPLALFGAFSWSLRRFAAATRNVETTERAGQRPNLSQALTAAGFRQFPTDKAVDQLRQLGRERAGKIYRWLLDTDLKLKGSHSSSDRARFAIETLILNLAKQAKPKPKPRR